MSPTSVRNPHHIQAVLDGGLLIGWVIGAALLSALPGGETASLRRSGGRIAARLLDKVLDLQMERPAHLHQRLQVWAALTGQDPGYGGLGEPTLLGERLLRKSGRYNELT